jgi:HPt (histidine-containing phosphotransfer) domain-containing protein
MQPCEFLHLCLLSIDGTASCYQSLLMMDASTVINHRKESDLGKLSDLGHFLKGSSAALGVCRVQAACEKIQHYGHLRDEEKHEDLSKTKALELIRETLVQVKEDYIVADKWLRKYYEQNDS